MCGLVKAYTGTGSLPIIKRHIMSEGGEIFLEPELELSAIFWGQ